VKPRRLLAPLFVALAILVALLFAVAWLPLREARDAWRAGRDGDAVAACERWSHARLWPASYDQLLAAAYLTAGNRAAAQPHLAGRPMRPLIAEEEVARRLFAKERYDDLLAYDVAFHDDSGALYRAAALAATNRAPDAAAALRAIDKSKVDAKKLAYLQNAIAGNVAWIVDRGGASIADAADFAPLVHSIPRGNASIETTLDPFVQRAALKALGRLPRLDRGHRSAHERDPRHRQQRARGEHRPRTPVRARLGHQGADRAQCADEVAPT
jgi:hypothetical protein